MIEVLPLVLKLFFGAWAILFVVAMLYATVEAYPEAALRLLGVVLSFVFFWFSVYVIVVLWRFIT